MLIIIKGISSMSRILTVTLIFIFSSLLIAQNITVDSPNNKINVALYNQVNNDFGNWYLKVNYKEGGNNCEVIP